MNKLWAGVANAAPAFFEHWEQMSKSADKQLDDANEFLTALEVPPHEIRSHRRPTHHKRSWAVALVVALSAGSVAASNTRPPVVAAAEVRSTVNAGVSVPPRVVEPLRTSQVSRSMARVSTRKVRIEKAIKFAMAQRGDRYRWGAKGPSRWDCSGLVMKSFQKAGVKLPRTTKQIIKKGKKVSRKNLQRGDIVFPQRGHVGIYLGGGKMIHASSGKGRVIVAKMYGFYTARRVL